MKKFIYVRLSIVDSLNVYYRINKDNKKVEEMLVFTDNYYCCYNGPTEILPTAKEDITISISPKKYYQKLRKTIIFKL